jgi:hypothetical protein
LIPEAVRRPFAPFEVMPVEAKGRAESDYYEDEARVRQWNGCLDMAKDAPRDLTLKQVIERISDLCWNVTMAVPADLSVLGWSGKEKWPAGGPWEITPKSRKP